MAPPPSPDDGPPFGRLARFASVLQELAGARDVDELLQLLVARVGAVVPDAEIAGVLVARPGADTISTASDPVATELGQVQQDTGEGPCLEALDGQPTVVAHDLATDHRWPVFTDRALHLGVETVRAYRLPLGTDTGGGRRGALNLFGTEPGLDDHDVQSGQVFAAHCTSVLAAAMQQAQAEDTLAEREVTAQARGILMVRHDVDVDRADAPAPRGRRTARAEHRRRGPRDRRRGDPAMTGHPDPPPAGTGCHAIRLVGDNSSASALASTHARSRNVDRRRVVTVLRWVRPLPLRRRGRTRRM